MGVVGCWAPATEEFCPCGWARELTSGGPRTAVGSPVVWFTLLTWTMAWGVFGCLGSAEEPGVVGTRALL